MASVSHPPVTFPGTRSLASRTSVTDLLQSSSNGICGMPLKTLGKARLGGARRRDFTVSAKVRKVKKHEYPWPQDPDPNVKGGILRHLSPFKPLKEEPMPVTLDFEKPLKDLQKKIIDVQKMANETGLDFTDQINKLENKYQQALKDLYTHLTPIQRVNISRHPNRPTFLDHVFNITEKFVELHGDRAGYDDPAVVTGLGTINGRSYMFIGHQKGRNTKENIQRNFGMPTPHGYRKALRMMYYADHHGFPIVTFIDTPGAFADLKSEELGQGEAIAHNLRAMFGLKVPTISIVIGEGGSGGALAIGCGNKLLMLENAVFYVASPEACAAILWKTAKASPKAAEKLKITAMELCKLQIADGVIPEPLGGAHADPYWTSEQIKTAIVESMDELVKMDTQELLRHRMLKFRKIGAIQEEIAADPKKKDQPIFQPGKSTELGLKGEVEKLKEKILKGRESSVVPESGLHEMIKKLKRGIDYEYSQAAKALGLEGKLVMLRREIAKARNSKDDPALKEKIEKLKEEFAQNLPAAPNYASLKYKLDILKKLSSAQNLSEKNKKAGAQNLSEKKKKAGELKQEVNKRLKAIIDRPNIQQKFEALKAEIEKSGASSLVELDQELKEKILQLKDEIDSESTAVLKSFNLHVSPPTTPLVTGKIDDFSKDVYHVIEDVISPDLTNKMETLKMEIAKAGKSPDADTQHKIKALEQEIKQSLEEATKFPELKEKHEKLKTEGSGSIESSGGSNGSLVKESSARVTEEVNA